MKRLTTAATAAGLLFGVCLLMTGCGQPSVGGDKMKSADGQMSAMSSMDRMADDRMSGGKMSDGKMGDTKMAGDKMADGKMSGGRMDGR